jgi:hypothetical protein
MGGCRLEEDEAVVTCRFGVRAHRSGSDLCFEVFDRTTGAAVAWGMGRAEAEAEARRRNHDTSGPPAVSVEAPLLGEPGAGVEASLAGPGQDFRVVVARVAQALDEAREVLAHADRLIVEAQGRIGDVYDVLPNEGDR